MSQNEDRSPPVHLYVRIEGQLPRIGCGKAVSLPRQYSDQIKKASCRKCAEHAPGLSLEQREELFQNWADRVGALKAISPWMRKKMKADRELAKQQAKVAREQEALLRKQRRAERQARAS